MPNINDSAFKLVNWRERFLNTDRSIPSYIFSHSQNIGQEFLEKWSFIDKNTQEVGRYEIYCAWKNGDTHVCSAFRTNDGKLVMYDPQNDEKDDVNLDDYIVDMDNNWIGVLRIDDKIINPLCAKLLTHK